MDRPTMAQHQALLEIRHYDVYWVENSNGGAWLGAYARRDVIDRVVEAGWASVAGRGRRLGVTSAGLAALDRGPR